MSAQIPMFDAGPARVVSMTRKAWISHCGRYRYTLERRWGDGSVAVFYLCNPSTAGVLKDDATVRKCIGFARRWACGSILIVNPFALRSRHPSALLADPHDSVGPSNIEAIARAVAIAKHTGGPFVVGWGMALPKSLRPLAIESVGPGLGVTAMCLGRTADGQPRHPLMVPYAQPLQVFEPRP